MYVRVYVIIPLVQNAFSMGSRHVSEIYSSDSFHNNVFCAHLEFVFSLIDRKNYASYFSVKVKKKKRSVILRLLTPKLDVLQIGRALLHCPFGNHHPGMDWQDFSTRETDKTVPLVVEYNDIYLCIPGGFIGRRMDRSFSLIFSINLTRAFN